MLKQRIIYKMLIENGVAVKYKNFTESRRIVGNPLSTLKIIEDQKVDEVFICDLGRAEPDAVRTITDALMTPVTVAGSIRTMEHVDALIQGSGAEKVVVKDMELAEAVAAKYGKQATVFAYDYGGEAGFYDLPGCVGEVLLTSVDRDGMGTGYDLAALRFDWPVPVVIAGGCGKLVHVKDAFDAGANAAAVSSMFAFSDKSCIKLRSWLVSEGCNVRPA